MTQTANTIQTGLFALSLEVTPGSEPETSAEGKPGHYIGGGVGTARGERVNGDVRWDLYEAQAPDRCDASFAGEITTEDGATVGFQTRGWLHTPDASQPHIWQTRSIVLFTTDSAEYSWLDGYEAVWEGQSDLSVMRHESSVYEIAE